MPGRRATTTAHNRSYQAAAASTSTAMSHHHQSSSTSASSSLPSRRPLGPSTMVANNNGGGSHWNEKSSSSSTISDIDNDLSTPFSSSFPSAPRRQPPTLNDSMAHYTNGGSTSGDCYDGTSTFREPGATARALASLQQQKYERQERRRALSLLGFLLITAVVMHLGSRGTTSMGSFMGTTTSEGRSGGGKSSSKGGLGFRGVTLGNMEDEEEDMTGASNEDGNDDATPGGEGDGGGNNGGMEEEEEDDTEEIYNDLRSYAEFGSVKAETDIPFFWHIPRSAGSTIKDIMGTCLDITIASEVGVRDGHQYDESLSIIEYKGQRYVNVDTTSLDGISRAKELGLASSGIPGVVVSSYLIESADLFDDVHKGRAFTLIRDPIERAVSMYYYMKSENEALSDLSLADFARGNGIENNWMVRYLVNQMEGELNRDALELAKEVLSRKFLIGLVEEKEESMARYRKYLEWAEPGSSAAAGGGEDEGNDAADDADKAEKQRDCISDLLSNGVNRGSTEYELPKKGSQERALIAHQTQYDLKLYEFAKSLFEDQTKKWGTKEYKKAEKKRKKKEKGGRRL